MTVTLMASSDKHELLLAPRGNVHIVYRIHASTCSTQNHALPYSDVLFFTLDLALAHRVRDVLVTRMLQERAEAPLVEGIVHRRKCKAASCALAVMETPIAVFTTGFKSIVQKVALDRYYPMGYLCLEEPVRCRAMRDFYNVDTHPLYPDWEPYLQRVDTWLRSVLSADDAARVCE